MQSARMCSACVCGSISLGSCLSDGAVCLTVPILTPPPPFFTNPHTLSVSLFFCHPFTLPHPHPLFSFSVSPSSFLCNNSADLVSACSGLPVEFYSGLPSWLLCCSKRRQKSMTEDFSPRHIITAQSRLCPPPKICRPKQMNPQ